MSKSRVHLQLAQVRYKKNFDRRLRRGNKEISEGDYVSLDVQDQDSKLNDTLGPHTESPYLVIDRTTQNVCPTEGCRPREGE